MNSVPWAIALFLFVFTEILTVNLISVWFAVGSLFALILSAMGVPTVWCVIAFLGISVAALCFLKPMADKCLNHKRIRTNADINIGKVAVAICDFENGWGRVRIRGMEWAAVALDFSDIKKGQKVIVENIVGVHLEVKAREN